MEYWRFRRYHIPPNGGGLRDQPARWFENAEGLQRVFEVFQSYMRREKGKDAAWAKAHPEKAQIVNKLRGLVWE